MASAKTRVALLAILALCAYLTSKTDAHLHIGRKEFKPFRRELREFLQDHMNPFFTDNTNMQNPGEVWESTIDEIPALYKQGTQDD